MTVNTSAGTRLYIGTTAADSSTDSYTLIGQVTNIPEFGKRYKEVDFSPLKDRGKQKSKGSYDDMTVTIELARDITDAGQTIALISRDSDINYNFKISLADSDIRFKAQVASFTNIIGTADNVIMRKMDLLVQSGTVAVTASGSDSIFSTIMPGAAGVWMMDRYSASPVPVVPNLVATSAPPGANLFQASRRLFDNSGSRGLWSNFSLAAVDSAVVGMDGTWSASTIVGTAGWALLPQSGDTIPAGTYTMALDVRRNTGSDQPFAFTLDQAVTRVSPVVATSTWQRIPYTFTLSSSTLISHLGILGIDGSTGANIQIDNFELYKGSKDLGPQVLAGHIYLGASAFDTRPVASGGVVDLSTGGWGLIQFPKQFSLGKFTATAVMSKVSAAAYNSFLSNPYAFATFTPFIDVSGQPYTSTSKALIPASTPSSGLWELLNDGYHVITLTYDGTTQKLYLDDILLFQGAENTTGPSLADFFVGITNQVSTSGGEKFAGSLFYPGVSLTGAQVRSNVAALKARLSNLTFPADRIYCAIGDSITGGFNYCYPYLFGPNSNPHVYGNNFGVSGSGLVSANTNAALVDSIIPTNPAGRKFILSILLGANDSTWIGGGSQYAADIAVYCDARRNAGWKVVLIPILPRANGAGGSPVTAHNIFRNAFNTTAAGWGPGLHYDGFADFAADPTMGTDTSAGNVTYYPDGLHPSAAGHAILETIIRPVINGL